ncbi:hypothetical protein QR680_017639 [Steinernema hermaphroditum]|uniref:Uncharacterized protein n=1 Tax=Steinernema hermaphroditum TaxID=289476 RepID=A0AA39HFY0_9BILA|nr:hypothetical protein QR680_017639 [Steinernema hermaphroditum]
METVGGEVPLWFVCVVVIPFLGIVVFLIFIVGHEMEIGVLRKRRRRFGSGECVDLVQLAYDLYVTQPPAHEHYVYKSFRLF